MNEITRPKFSSFRWPGWPAWLGIAISAITCITTVVLGTSFGNAPGIGGPILGWGLLLGVAIQCTILFGLDQSLYLKKQSRILETKGFDFDSDDRDLLTEDVEQIIPALIRMTPTLISPIHIKRWGGLTNAPRPTFAGIAHIPKQKIELSWIIIAVKISTELPNFVLGISRMGQESRMLKSGARKLNVNHSAFGKHRNVYIADDTPILDEELLTAVLEVTGQIFYIPGSPRLSFRLTEAPGLLEQWSLNENWLAYAVKGRPRAKPMLEAVEFVTTVAQALEAEAPVTGSPAAQSLDTQK